MKQKLPNFKVLTKKSVLDISYKTSKQYEEDCKALVEEQNKILQRQGFDIDKSYNIHFYDSYYTSEVTISIEITDAIQCLAIKDGYDLVEFDNGKIGYVAYYNGNKNGFEFISKGE